MRRCIRSQTQHERSRYLPHTVEGSNWQRLDNGQIGAESAIQEQDRSSDSCRDGSATGSGVVVGLERAWIRDRSRGNGIWRRIATRVALGRSLHLCRHRWKSLGRRPKDVHVSPTGEDWLRSQGVLQSSQRLGPDVHGLAVFQDDLRFSAGGQPTGIVTHDPQEFICAIEQSATIGVSSKTQQAIRVLDLAHISDSPIAKVVLAISSIEALATDSQGWSSTQFEMVRQAAGWVRGEFGESVGTSSTSPGNREVR